MFSTTDDAKPSASLTVSAMQDDRLSLRTPCPFGMQVLVP
jgi:hypothetical protein